MRKFIYFRCLGGILGEIARTQTPNVVPTPTIVQPVVQPVLPAPPSKIKTVM